MYIHILVLVYVFDYPTSKLRKRLIWILLTQDNIFSDTICRTLSKKMTKVLAGQPEILWSPCTQLKKKILLKCIQQSFSSSLVDVRPPLPQGFSHVVAYGMLTSGNHQRIMWWQGGQGKSEQRLIPCFTYSEFSSRFFRLLSLLGLHWPLFCIE